MGRRRPLQPRIMVITKKTRKRTNSTCEIPATLPATPPKPKIAAMTAIPKNTPALCGISDLLGRVVPDLLNAATYVLGLRRLPGAEGALDRAGK